MGVLLRRALKVVPNIGAWAWANPGCQIVVVLLASLLVAVQVWFTLTFAGEVQRSGLLRVPGSIDVAVAAKEETTSETMPLRDKRALAKSFLGDFGVDHAVVERRAHGAIYQLFREDKGFLFGTLLPYMPMAQSDDTLHYLIVRDNLQITLEQGREAKVGGYTIVAYHPIIEYSSWQWSVRPEPEWWDRISEDSAWAPLTLPARQVPDPTVWNQVPYAGWPGKTVAFRGRMAVSSVGQPVWMVFNIRNSYASRHELGRLHLNGQPLKAAHTISHDTINSRNVEVLLDVPSDLHAGSNLIAFEVTRTNGEFDLDLYELRLALGTGRR
jgi:hypothetical protein